jgi:pimeloyl-ACP methyl ester carboxylesterase
MAEHASGSNPGLDTFRSDSQQWAWDLAIQQTGRVQHFFESRQLPASVKTFAMVSKQLGKQAQRLERLAAAEAAAGHRLTAVEYYFDAAAGFARAQHNVLQDNAEKRFLHGSSRRCYDAIRALSRTPIERIEVPFEGNTATGYLHLAPVEGPAPLVFFLPGIDMTKETIPPHEAGNWATQRDMHIFVFDGPGQGESNLSGLRLTVDNYERAVSTTLTHLVSHAAVDPERVGLYGMSFASYWAVRVAATEPRFKAAVFQWASMTDMHYLFDGYVSPRYKRVLAFVSRLDTEEEVDNLIEMMSVEGMAGAITVPTLTTVGEFDQRSPLDEVYEFFDSLGGPAEMWVFADQHHMLSVRGKSNPMATALDSHSLGMDWLRDRLDGSPPARPGEVIYLEPGGPSPNDPKAPAKRRWYEI